MNKLINIKTGGGRESKFELLRLLSMLMVLNLHSFHGYDYGSGIMQGLDWFRESTSICAVNVFIMISGYFGIKWKFRSFFNLIFQLLFYSFAVYGVCVALGIFSFEMSSFLSCLILLSNNPVVGNYLYICCVCLWDVIFLFLPMAAFLIIF